MDPMTLALIAQGVMGGLSMLGGGEEQAGPTGFGLEWSDAQRKRSPLTRMTDPTVSLAHVQRLLNSLGGDVAGRTGGGVSLGAVGGQQGYQNSRSTVPGVGGGLQDIFKDLLSPQKGGAYDLTRRSSANPLQDLSGRTGESTPGPLTAAEQADKGPKLWGRNSTRLRRGY